MNMTRKKLLAVLAAGLILIAAACWAYVSDYYHADETAVSAMAASEGVHVEQPGDALVFMPDEPKAGFIFYPGGKVEYTAYAPLMRALAENGILCVLTRMPLNLAVLDMNAADGIPAQYPQVDRWFIGGHSLGGSMAASHAAKNTGLYEGLVLLASYSTADLSSSGMEVISIYGSEDGVLNMEKYAAYKGNLPSACQEHIIEGGCHAGFGSYGPQAGDGTPAISGETQTNAVVFLLMDFFN